nr:uncharacterized protein LOC129278863 [Lytechinus pictus]
MDLEYSGFNLSSYISTEELLPNYVDYDPLEERFYFMERFGDGVSVDGMGRNAVFFANGQDQVAGMRVHPMEGRVFWVEHRGTIHSVDKDGSNHIEFGLGDEPDGSSTCGCKSPRYLALELDEINDHLFISTRTDIFHVIRTNLTGGDNLTLSDLDWMPIRDLHFDGVRLFYASGFGELGHINPDGEEKTILYVAPGSNPLLFNIAKYGELVFVHEDLFNTEFNDYALSIINIPDESLIEQRTGFATSDGEHEFGHIDRFRVRLPPNAHPPSITCPSNMNVPTESGLATARVSWAEPSYADAETVSFLKFLGPKDNDTDFQLGNTRLTYMVVDEGGRTARCFFIVTVFDDSNVFLLTKTLTP